MTELDEITTTPLDEALALIDERLGALGERQLMSATEVTDLLLDVRSLLSAPKAANTSSDDPADQPVD